jgi:hypothetical protein
VSPVDIGEVAAADEGLVVHGPDRPVEGVAGGHAGDLRLDDLGHHVRVVDLRHVPIGHDLGIIHQPEDLRRVGLGERAERQPLGLQGGEALGEVNHGFVKGLRRPRYGHGVGSVIERALHFGAVWPPERSD